uniref:DNA topoisomerase n=1 Tax=Panagrolaimus sp. PS1159 TaxID=55785 RepID=A0AC35GRK6_9BILA
MCSRGHGGNNHGRTFYAASNINGNYENVDGDALPEGHYNGEIILDELLARFQFDSINDFENYQNEMYTRFFKYVENRPLEILMVAEKVAMAEELAKNLSGNQYKKRRFYKDLGLDPSVNSFENHGDHKKLPFLDVFEFKYNFRGFDSRVWMVATSGHVYSHDFENPVKEPQQAFFHNIKDVSKNRQKCLPILLEMIAKDSDAVVLWLDNDLEGEAIAFEVINTVKNGMRIPPGAGSFMDVMYRIKFSSAQEANDSMQQQLKRPDFRKLLAMTAQHILDLIWGKCFTRHQKMVLRARFPKLNIDDLPFGPCQAVALALTIEEFEIKQMHTTKYNLVAAIDDGKIVAMLDSEGFANRENAEELCQRLKAFENCEVISETISTSLSVEALPGLNTFELLIYMSRYHSLSSSDVAYIAQRLYDQGLITYPRTESTKFPFYAGELVQNVLKTFKYRTVGIVENINPNLKIFIDAAMSKGIDKGDHPPIIPTFKCPTRKITQMETNEALVYSFICCRFLASFMQEYTYFKETTIFGIEDCKFEYSCFKAGEDGFTKVLPKLKVKTIEEDQEISRNFILGQKILCDIQIKEIPPPKLLHEWELIKKMEENNVGTDGTIPTHISTLQKTGYVEADEKSREITPTLLGIYLMDSYKTCIGEAIDPKFRAKFIKDINGIASGENDFIEVFDRSLKEIWKNYKKFAANFDSTKIDLDKFQSCFKEIDVNAATKNISSASRDSGFRRR